MRINNGRLILDQEEIELMGFATPWEIENGFDPQEFVKTMAFMKNSVCGDLLEFESGKSINHDAKMRIDTANQIFEICDLMLARAKTALSESDMATIRQTQRSASECR